MNNIATNIDMTIAAIVLANDKANIMIKAIANIGHQNKIVNINAYMNIAIILNKFPIISSNLFIFFFDFLFQFIENDNIRNI